MDEIKAQNLFKEINGSNIDNIIIDESINHGKSAAVFLGHNENDKYAIKIFDNELIERYGVEIQTKRISLELSLKNHKIDNLVKIINGNNITINGIQYFYIIMQYIEGVNLKQYINQHDITTEFIIKVITTLINTSENLIKSDPPLAHRDIKPENIMISSNGDVILMDLGVLKIIDNPSITDIGQKQFLGTLRYSPPEFLTRKEDDSIDGWRSINIYQIGAVLHDLIMKKELFDSIEPYPNLVIAIKEDMPKIINNDYPADLLQLARNMLLKDWKTRLEYNSIDKILITLNNCLLPQTITDNYFDEIKKNTINIRQELDEISKISRDLKEKQKIKEEHNKKAWAIILSCFNDLKSNDIINSIEYSPLFKVNEWREKDFIITNCFFKIEGKFEYGFIKPLFILFRVDNNESSHCKILTTGILMDKFFKPKLQQPRDMLNDIFAPNDHYNRQRVQSHNYTVNFKVIFDGIFEPEDNMFKQTITQAIAAIIKKSVDIMKPEVTEELNMRKQMLDHRGIHVGMSFVRGKTIISEF